MPNHVHNILTVLGATADECKKILKSVQNDEEGGGSISFQKIIPMPESLNITSGSETDNSLELLLTMKNPDTPNYGLSKIEKKVFKATVERLNESRLFIKYNDHLEPGVVEQLLENGVTVADGEKALKNLFEYGAKDWYDWRIKNWSTKWNAYDFGNEHLDYVVFNTAWSAPIKVIAELSKQYPKQKFELVYVDEDLGNNCGNVMFQNGKIIEEDYPAEGSDEAIEFAKDMWEIE